MFTRRSMLLAAGFVAGASLSPLRAAQGNASWHVISELGGHRVAKNRVEALQYFDALVPRMGFSADTVAYFRSAVQTPGRRVEITNEQYRFMGFSRSGVRGVEPYVWLDARAAGKKYFAERWVNPATGETLDLPEACENWARPFSEHHCFEFALGFGGRKLAAFFWFDELEGASDETVAGFWQKLSLSPCYTVRFADGTRTKPTDGCAICQVEQFVGWPPTLPTERRRRARHTLTIPADSSGQTRILSFPRWAAVHYATYCPEVPGVWQGYVDPAVTRARLLAGAWDYGTVIESDPLRR